MKSKNTIENINEEELLEKCRQMRPVQYFFNKDKPAKLHYGFIAQEMKEILPHLVSGKETENSYLAINYVELVSAIPALAKKIKEIEDKLN